MVEVRHFGRFFACDRDMEDGFGVVLVLDRLHIPAYLVHIPEHLPDEVDALLIDGHNICSIGVRTGSFHRKHRDDIRPVADGQVTAAVRLPVNHYAIGRVLGLYPADFGGKLAVDARHRLRNGLGIAVIARPEHTEGCPDDRRRAADDQDQRNERTGTTQKSHRRPRHGLSGTDNGTFDLLKPFCSAFRCLRGLLCGFPQELLLHFLSGVCCDLCLCFHRCLSNRLRLPPCERPFTERLFSSLGRCRCGFPAPIRLRSRCIGRNRGGRIRKAMLLQRKIVLHPKGFLFRFPHHSFPATFGLLFRLLLPELLLGAHDLRRIALTQRSRIFHPLFRLGGNNGAVKLLLRQRLAGAERRPCADFRRSLCGGFKPAHRFGERRLRIFRLLCIFSVKLTTSRLFPQHLRRLFGEKRRGLPRLNIPVLGARPYLFHSDSPGFVVIRRYSAVFRGNWLMNGTSAPPTLMRPCPDSALLM